MIAPRGDLSVIGDARPTTSIEVSLEASKLDVAVTCSVQPDSGRVQKGGIRPGASNKRRRAPNWSSTLVLPTWER